MRLPAVLALSLVPAAAQALTPPPGKIPMRPKMEYLRPFRNPDKNLQPPMELYEELRTMLAIARDPSVKKSYDEEGREVCDHSAWREAMSRAQIKSARMGGYLAVVCQESGDAGDRALALYGAYWLDSLQDTISILALIPGEPVPHLREEAMLRALPFLRVQLAKNRGGEGGARKASPVDHAHGNVIGGYVYEHPDAPLYDFDVAPWCALLETPQARDRAQGLWFLAEVAAIRREYGLAALGLVQHLLPALAIEREAEVRRHARRLLATLDPRERPEPVADAPDDEVRAWVEAVLYEIFPPIRQVSSGLIELYPSKDLDRIIATGKDVLERDAIGQTASGKVNGMFYRGFKVQRIPEPLDLLRLPKDAVITHVNGQPVTDSATLLRAIEATAGKGSLMVEYVASGQQYAIEYKLMQ